ncbi:MAG: PDZ domain-containing protein, partial [Chloroflexi bacterium]|nr:PDZ domain-containing protein [Chloroflexota bacterium]
MRRVAASLLIAMAVLALTAVIVSNSGSSQANNEQGDQSTPDPQPLALSEVPETTNNVPDRKPNTEPGDVVSKGFVGISISSLPEAEADELGIEGGVLVNHVIDDGPSAGILLVGDVITTVNGQPVAETENLIDFVWSVQPGDTVAFTVVRDGETLDLSVVAGERELHTVRKFAQRIPDGLRGLQGLRGLGGNVFGRITDALFDRFVSAEVVVKTDDGFMTIAAVTGTVRSVNIGAGTFLLDAADGNGDVEFTISDDTMVNLTTQGDLSGLNLLGIVFGGVIAVHYVSNYSHQVILARVGQLVVFDLRRDLFAHLQRLSMSFHNRNKVGSVMSRAQNDVYQ